MSIKKLRLKYKNWDRTKFLNWGLAIFLFLMPWQTRWIFGNVEIAGEYFQYGVASLYMTEFLLLIVALAVGKLQWKKKYKTSIVRSIMVVWVAAILTLIFALNKSLGAIQLMHLVFAVMLFIALLDKRVNLRFQMKAFALGMIAPIILGAYQFFTGGSPASTIFGLALRDAEQLGDAVLTQNGVRTLRAYGSFPHPNIMGGYTAIALVAVFSIVQSAKEKIEKYLYAFVGVILSFGLIISFSRSAWIGLFLAIILAVIILLAKNPKQGKMIAFPVSIVVIAIAIFLTVFSSHIQTRFDTDALVESRSVTERLEQYQEYPDILGTRWLTGFGLGNYTAAIERFDPNREWWEYQPIHNVPFLVLAELGLLGLLAVMAWAGANDAINFRRFPNIDAVVAFMMGNVILVILFLDHYIWTSWSGIVLAVFMMALTARMGEDED